MDGRFHPGLDVVTVPDFVVAGRKFEARTLFFLASWMECGPKQYPCSLHLACIGEPPNSVRILAKRAGASVSVHEPLGYGDGEFMNKLRGLEIVPRHSRFLLLDTDVLFWADPSTIVHLGDCTAASVVGRPRVPGDYWPRMFAELKMPMPEKRISCRWHQLGEKFAEEAGMERQDNMIPCFNAGVIYGMWSAEIREKWGAHSKTIFNAFRDRAGVPRSFSTCLDQVSFATVIQELRSTIPFRILPDRYHVIRPVLARSNMPLGETVLLHAVGFLSQADTRASIPREVHDYEKITTGILRRRAERLPSGKKAQDTSCNEHCAAREAAQFRLRLRRLYREYVAPFFSDPTQLSIP